MKKQIVVFLFLFVCSALSYSQQFKNGVKIAADTVIHDIAVLSTNLKAHGSTSDLSALKVVLKNCGTYTYNFYVLGEIYNSQFRSSEAVFVILHSGETKEIDMSFSNLSPGKYHIIIWSQTNMDDDRTNDTLHHNIELHENLPEAFWHSEPEMPASLKDAAAAFYNIKAPLNAAIDTGYVFLFGGYYEDQGFQNSIMKYNMASKRWNYSGTFLPENLSNFHAAESGGKIYIPGGYLSNTDGFSDKLYIYDIETDALSEGADMLFGCYSHALGIYNDSLIYVIGGDSLAYLVNQVQVYNINTNTWKYGTPFPGKGRVKMGGSICGNKIVLAGGYYYYEDVSKVDIGIIDPKDPYTITWQDGGEYPGGACVGMSAASWHGKNEKYIIFTGGYSESSTKNLVTGDTWAYDAENDKWLACPDKLADVMDAMITTIVRNDSVFVASIGGWNAEEQKSLRVNEWLYISPYDPVLDTIIDAMAKSIDMDDTLHINRSYAPKASFKNMHSPNQTFEVTMEISPGDYKDVDTVRSLPNLGVKQVVFDKWTPPNPGIYTFKAYTSLGGDWNTSNDTLTFEVYIREGYPEAFWHSEPEMPAALSAAAASFYNKKASGNAAIDTGYIFVMGGYGKNSDFNTIMKYNMITQKWSYSDTSLPYMGYDMRIVQIGGKMYIPGGNFVGKGYSSKLYIYDIEADTLGEGADMLYGCSAYAIEKYNDSLIYVIGGSNSMFLNQVQIYNINSNAWGYGTSFGGNGCVLLLSAISKNKIILTGGECNDISKNVRVGIIDTVNPYIINWTTAGENPFGEEVLMSAASWSYKNKTYLFVTGGGRDYSTDDASVIKDTWAYDVDNDKWFACPDKISNCCDLTTTTVVRNDSVYVAALGGWTMYGHLAANEWLYVGYIGPDTIVAVSEEPNSPAVYSLNQNYPNPFNPMTVIKYSLAEAGQVELRVYNILGQEVITLVNELKSAGMHEVKFNAAGMNLSSGVYIYRIKAGSFVQTKKLMLIK